MDYEYGPYNFTITAGTTTTAINISITDDNILENNETFHLTIDPSSLPKNVFVNNPFQVEVTIVDFDCKYTQYY